MIIDKSYSFIGIGKFQKYLIFSLINCSFLVAIISLSYSYLTKLPSFLCRSNPNENYTKCDFNEEKFCNNPTFEYIKDPSNSLINWAYSFDLYCNNSIYIPIIGSGFFIGGIFGCLIITPLPDKYGRKIIFQITLTISCIIHYLILFSFNPLLLSLFCIISGFISSIYGNFSVIVSEYISRDISGIIMSIVDAIYPTMGFLEAFFFMTINNWRILFLITSILHTISTYIILFYLVESPKWLFSQEKIEETLNSLRKIAYINNKKNEWLTYEKIEISNFKINKNNENINTKNNNEINTSYSIIEILQKFPSQRKVIFILSITFFSSSFCFYGIILSISSMKGNFFINSLLSFLGEAISELSSGFISQKIGRVPILKYGGLIGGIGFIGNQMATYNLKSIFLLISMMGFSSTLNCLYIYTPEIIPTKIRSTVCGMLYFCGMISPSFVPIIKSVFYNFFGFFFVFFGFVYSFFCFFLEETLNKNISDYIPEEMFFEQRNLSSGNFNEVEEISVVDDFYRKSIGRRNNSFLFE